MPNPTTFKSMKKITGSLTIQDRSSLELRSCIHHAEDRVLLGTKFDPKDISLNHLIEAVSRRKLSRRSFVRLLVALASNTVISSSSFEDNIRSTTARQKFSQLLRVRMSKVPVQSLHSSNSFRLVVGEELDDT